MDIKEFLDKWWVELLCTLAVPFIWKLVHGWVKKTKTTVDDQIVELVDEVVETYQAGKAAKEVPREATEPQTITSPPLTEEQKQQLNSN